MSFEMVSAIKLFPFKLFLLQQLIFQAPEFVKMLRNLFKCKLIDMTPSMIRMVSFTQLFVMCGEFYDN